MLTIDSHKKPSVSSLRNRCITYPQKIIIYVFITGIYMFSLGCATIIHGTSQKVKITSAPSGANVLITPGNMRLITPATVNLKRDGTYFVYYEKSNYVSNVVTIKSKPSVLMWMDLLFTGSLGFIVDYPSGGGYKLEPNNVFVRLQEEIESE